MFSSDAKKISGVYLENPMAEYTVLFSHGNAEDLGTIDSYLKEYYRHQFSILAYDYPGYGTSEGFPTESNAYKAIDAAYRYLIETKKIPSEKIIVHGRSIGTGPSIDLAMRMPIAGLIVESGMLSAYRVITHIPLFPIDAFPNNVKINKVHKPILFIHGNKDNVIPFWHGKKLYELVEDEKYFYVIENAGHNNINEKAGEEYWDRIESFSKKLSHLNQ